MEAIQYANALHPLRAGNISQFEHLHHETYSEMLGPLEAEQWLIEMENVLKIVRVLNTDTVNVIKIQLINVAETL